MSLLLPLMILGGVGLYLMTPAERLRAGRALLEGASRAIRVALTVPPGAEPWCESLRARTRWPIVTPAILTIHIAIFLQMLVAPGSFSDPQTLVAWGGNFAPRTTNGEWWRLVASTFVHDGPIHLLASIVGLVPLGFLLERAVGRTAFATVFVASGVLAGLVSLSTSAVAVSVGASGAIFGVHGLLIGCAFWSVVQRPDIPVPWAVVKRVAVCAAMFLTYNLVTASVSTEGEFVALGGGLACGLLIAKGVARERVPVRRSALVLAGSLVVAMALAWPIRGLADVRPEIERVIQLEARTSEVYDAAVEDFKKGWIGTDALVRVIETSILPDLRAARARVKALQGVPREHAAMVAAAREYFALRETAWRQRSTGLRGSSMSQLRDADRAEQASLQAFYRIKPAERY